MPKPRPNAVGYRPPLPWTAYALPEELRSPMAPFYDHAPLDVVVASLKAHRGDPLPVSLPDYYLRAKAGVAISPPPVRQPVDDTAAPLTDALLRWVHAQQAPPSGLVAVLGPLFGQPSP